MSRFDNRIRPILEQVEALQAKLDEVPDDIWRKADETLDGALERTQHVLETVGLLAAETPVEMVNQNMVDTMIQALNQLGVHMETLAGNPAAVAAIEQQTDGVVAATVSWPTVPRLSESAGKQVADSVAATIGDAAHKFEASLERLQAEAEAGENANAEKLSALETAIATAEANLVTRLDVYSASLEQEKQRTDALIAEYQRQFGQEETERRRQHEALRDELSVAAKEVEKQLSASADQELRRLRTIRQQAEAHAGAVAMTGTATAFGQDAARERQAADIWRFVAVGCALLAALVAGLLLVWRPFDAASALSVASVAGRVTLALLLGGIATYAGRQSSDHRTREIRSRRLELELTAFRPFIEGLAEETKEKLRTDFVDRLFKGADGTDQALGDSPTIGGDQITLLGNVADIVAKILRSK